MKKFLDKLIKWGVFWPISKLWEGLYQLRRNLYQLGPLRSKSFDVPIISIGNLTFGGTGKTPFTIWFANYLAEQGFNPLILTRGYKGALEHSVGVLKGGETLWANPVDFGDEALLIARNLLKGHVIVGKNRSQNLDYYFDRLMPDVVLLDDGHQHLKIQRNFNVVLFDALCPLESYRAPPLGNLREGFGGLFDADAIVLSRSDQVSSERRNEIKNYLSRYVSCDVLWLEIGYCPAGLFNPSYQKIGEASFIKDKRVIAVAGLASPHSFFILIESLGGELIERKFYDDHYYFTESDLSELLALASLHNAIIITSEKDMVKIRRISRDPRIYFLAVEVKVLNGEADFKQRVAREVLENREKWSEVMFHDKGDNK